jgi:hypothetical protein
MPIGLKGNTDGSGAVQIGGSDAISISTGLNTTFAGTITATGTVAGTTGTLYPIVSGTAVSATGTAVDFTGIPSWAKRITVMFNGVSLNGTQNFLIQIGSGSITSSGYLSASTYATTVVGSINSTSGFCVVDGNAGHVVHGIATIALVGSNIYVSSHTFGLSNVAETVFGGGSVTLGGALDRVRITNTGTDTFDAGSINILFE